MIKGRYEIKIYFDVDGNRSKKELTMGDTFDDSTQFVARLLSDLQSAGPMIDRYIPTVETKEPEDADI